MDPLLENRLAELDKVVEKVKLGGGQAKIDKQHAKGKLTAKERLDLLIDPGSFVALNPMAGHANDLSEDGLICGSAKIDGRKVFVYSQDATVRGGSVGIEHGIKMYKTIEKAVEMRVPLIGLHDSPGARLPNAKEMDLMDQAKRAPFSHISDKHGGAVFMPNTIGSGLIPQISGILGTCAGISVYSPALNDFIFMVDKTSHMFITGPMVVKMVTGEDITNEELGGSIVHSQVTGSCDIRTPDEKECLANIRRLISFLPLNCDEQPPVYQSSDDPDRLCTELHDIVPATPNKSFDIRHVIYSIVDSQDFMEIKPEFACEVVVGFGRLDGKTVGIVANQPMVKSGSMTTDSSDKQARFIRFCDCFNIKVLLLVDTPAYMPGSSQEHAGIIRHGAKVLYALCEASVPKIVLVLRKAYGGGNLGMGVLPGLGTDLVLYWPLVETGILGAEQSVMILYGADPKAGEPGFMDKKLAHYKETYANPIYDLSSNMNVNDIVKPAESRQYLIKAFDMLEGKKRETPKKHHGNIPL